MFNHTGRRPARRTGPKILPRLFFFSADPAFPFHVNVYFFSLVVCAAVAARSRFTFGCASSSVSCVYIFFYLHVGARDVYWKSNGLKESSDGRMEKTDTDTNQTERKLDAFAVRRPSTASFQIINIKTVIITTNAAINVQPCSARLSFSFFFSPLLRVLPCLIESSRCTERPPQQPYRKMTTNKFDLHAGFSPDTSPTGSRYFA